jgi:branched-chain amino acid aminotransferase
LDLAPVERTITLAEVYDGLDSGEVVEVFACGTAAVITPINSLRDENGGHEAPGDHTTTLALRQRLCDIQWGRVDDPFGWMQQVA